MPLRSSMQQEREVQILKVAEALMARHGRENLTFTLLAESLSMGRATLRHLFADLDEILARILRDHLRRIFKALGTIPHDAPDRRRLQRELYVQETHHPCGGLTDAHLLLTRDRHLLPEDLLPSIEQTRIGLGIALGAEDPEETLTELDDPSLAPANAEPEIVATLALLASPANGSSRYGPTMPPHIARQLESGDNSWLRPAGLGSITDAWPGPSG